MTYHLILNPAAGRGRARRCARRLVELARRRLKPLEVHTTERPGHARELVSRMAGDADTVIAAGGDGTIFEVVNGLGNSGAALGVIPIGSGNDFVRSVGLPGDVASAIDIIRRGNHRAVDVGLANGYRFVNGLGIGFDARAVVESRKIKWLRGLPLYLLSVLKAAWKYRNQKVRLHIDGDEEERPVFMISVGNGEYLGGGFRINPGARIDDGWLEVCIFQALRKSEIFRYLPLAVRGAHLRLPQVQQRRAQRLRVEAEEPLPVHADGELLSPHGFHSVEVSLQPGALRVCVPGDVQSHHA